MRQGHRGCVRRESIKVTGVDAIECGATVSRAYSFALQIFVQDNADRCQADTFPGPDLVLGQTWERHETLDRDGIMNLYWTPNLESGEITFELHAKTQGWAGLGFSANGAMTGSDVVVGWIKDGQTYFTDRHAVGNELSLVDESQDYELLFSSEGEEGLILRFKRLFDTCDENDFYITSDTWSLIYAYGETDPDGEDPFHEGRDHRVPSMGNGWKRRIRGPFEVDGFTLNEGEEEVFEQFMQNYPHGSSCFDPDISYLIGKCQSVLQGWAVSGVGEKYPEHAGYPLRPDSEGPTYYRMEMHYNNPQLIDDIHDESGLTIYYTDNLRTYDMGTIVFGSRVVYTELVPPGLGDFMTVGHCPGECTEMFIPPEGIHIFSGLLHSHLLGRKMRARIFRDGEELPWIFHDEHYDSDFQQSRILREEFLLLPGDHITVECDLDSSEREDVTLGGLTDNDEMCEFFVMYYPRVELNHCSSTMEYQFFHTLFELGGVHLNTETLNWELDGTNQILQEHFRGFDWENFDVEAYQEAVRFSPQQGTCGGVSYFLEVKDVTFPEYENDYIPPPRKCPVGNSDP
ncbi:unnamed protein product [Darwinula stevensoni]|uniref:DOMON domain-containing protein n=1 Tax=Darwinula stevensoni TaxID=69355 RepID=A0A7R9AEQ6_9CRUS|nr:unnamed protein product [Darwinula stevensoni]CAG0901630.1 unnamed protein product [Darwinula stevensoni]